MDKHRALQHMRKRDVYVPWASSPTGITHRHVTVRKSHGCSLMQELLLPATFLKKLTSIDIVYAERPRELHGPRPPYLLF